MNEALVIGAGPAGLMAAEVLAQRGLRVCIAEAKPSPARKFLMAGKSGLNLTKSEPFEHFVSAFAEAAPQLKPILEAFGPDHVRHWAQDLGQPLFTGSTGRVFPKAMKASPLLRAWLARLEAAGVVLHRRWRWTGWHDKGVVFETPDGATSLSPSVTILACGGASWARLGSDGSWTSYINQGIAPFKPANIGFVIEWSNHMLRFFGQPVKGIALTAGSARSRGEITISKSGIEGGGIYSISRNVREGSELFVDLLPDMSEARIRQRLTTSRGKASLSNHLRKSLQLTPVKQALLMEFGKPLPDDLAPLIKALPVPHHGPRPIDEAISTAGGLRFAALDDGLMLRDRPGTFAAGEMLDWEAPTGGYLLTACFATGRWAGHTAADWVQSKSLAL